MVHLPSVLRSISARVSLVVSLAYGFSLSFSFILVGVISIFFPSADDSSGKSDNRLKTGLKSSLLSRSKSSLFRTTFRLSSTF